MANLVFASYLSQALDVRAQWGVNFAQNLSANNVFGIDAATLADIKNGTDWEFYATISHPNYLTTYSKACTEWRREIDSDATPQLIALPVYDPPTPPAAPNTMSGVFNRIVDLVNTKILPAQPSPALMALLQLNPLAPPAATDLVISSPSALPGGHVAFTMARGHAKLFQIECRRAAERTFTLLDKVTLRAFMDNRANVVAGVSESRTYRYKDANDPLGQYSAEVTVATQA